MVFLTAGFASETAEKRLDLKSPMGQTKAEELGARFARKLMQNSATEGAPRGDGLS